MSRRSSPTRAVRPGASTRAGRRGDKPPSGKDSEEAGSSAPAPRAVRAIDADLEDGDPFASGLTDYQRASRLQGRKIVTAKYQGEQVYESLYLVEGFHQFLSNRGSNGRGLVQFFGPRARREYRIGKKPPAWVATDDGSAKRTLEIGDGLEVRPREKK